MRMVILLWLILGIVTSAAASGMAGAEQAFREGNRAYEAGDRAAALSNYEAALSTGYESAAVHFNIGNVHLVDGDYARATVSFLRALRLDRDDPRIIHNLAVAQRRAGLSPAVMHEGPIRRALLSLYRFAGPAVPGALAYLFYLGTVCVLAWALWQRKLHAPLRRTLYFLVPMLVAATAIYVDAVFQTSAEQAVVISRNAEVIAAGGSDSRVEVRSAQIVRILSGSDAFYTVRLADGTRGRIPRNAVILV